MPMDKQLSTGEYLYRFFSEHWGEEAAKEYARKRNEHRARSQTTAEDAERGGEGHAGNADEDAEPKLPHGFWSRFFKEAVHLEQTPALQTRYRRCLHVYLDRWATGAQTRMGMRQGRSAKSMRSSGGAMNSQKGAEIGYALLQWFVDKVEGLKLRISGSMLVDEARHMVKDLIKEQKRDPDSLPKLNNYSTARSWLQRWRRWYNISRRYHWNRLKVSWAKVKKRCRILLSNIFRLATPGS